MTSEIEPAPPAERSDELRVLQQARAGQFEIIRELGRGGMGLVVLGSARFLREARTAAQLCPPSIVPIYRADEVPGGLALGGGRP